MSANKTVQTREPVENFISSVDDEQKRKDSMELLDIMGGISGSKAKMWGKSLVGFGKYHYRYASGREGEFFLTGFSPRKTALTVYIMPGFSNYADLMDRLGPHKTGKSCLYLKNLDAVDREVLNELISRSVADMRKKYPCED